MAQLVKNLQCGRPRFYPWVGKGRLPSPVGASLVAQLVKNLPAMQETWVQSLGLEDPLEKRKSTHSSILACMGLQRVGFLTGSAGKESACNAGDPSSIPGSGRSPGEGIGYPLQYSWASLSLSW